MIEAIFSVFLLTSIIIFIINKKYLSYIPNKIYKYIDDNTSKILLQTLKSSYTESDMLIKEINNWNTFLLLKSYMSYALYNNITL